MTPDDCRIIRERMGLTQAQLAERLGVSPDTIAARESGRLAIGHEAELALHHLADPVDLYIHPATKRAVPGAQLQRDLRKALGIDPDG